MTSLLLFAFLGIHTSQVSPSEGSAVSAIAVVRMARGEVRVVSKFHPEDTLLPARVGILMAVGDRVTTNNGWGEVLVGAHLRMRLSAQTDIVLHDERNIEIVRGRLWIEIGTKSPRIGVRVGLAEVGVQPKTSVVFESTPAASVTVFRGQVDLPTGVKMSAGYTSPVDGHIPPRIGGRELQALVRRETRAGLGDLAGWKAFLLTAVAATEPGDSVPLPIEEVVRTRGMPSATGAPDLVLEEALRPPLFLLEETIRSASP